MNHPAEERAGDPSPQAVSSGDAIHHHYHDFNGKQHKEQSSSSSDSDSDEDLFQLEATELGDASTKPPTAPIFADNEISLSAKFLSRKPPRYDVPDPNRIPMTVFARNTATASPKEWSVASNESLFSIHMGNSSFSREQGMFLMGRSGDLGNFTSGVVLEYPLPRPPITMVAEEGKAKRVDVMEMQENVVELEAMKEKMTGHLLVDSISRQSDCSSTTSFGSFAFPVLATEGISESIKVLSKEFAEHQPPPLVNPLDAPTTSPSSAKRRWFPCFSWCQLCC